MCMRVHWGARGPLSPAPAPSATHTRDSEEAAGSQEPSLEAKGTQEAPVVLRATPRGYVRGREVSRR